MSFRAVYGTKTLNDGVLRFPGDWSDTRRTPPAPNSYRKFLNEIPFASAIEGHLLIKVRPLRGMWKTDRQSEGAIFVIIGSDSYRATGLWMCGATEVQRSQCEIT